MEVNLLKTIKRLIFLVIILAVIVVSAEIFSREYLGLGTPPLSISHPSIEYMFKPNQDLQRFGNHIIINQYGMRTTPFPAHKIDNEFRLMVYGDSVLNGGNLTDHNDLATTILQKKLSEEGNIVVVGNISAGSWGPGNWLAYVKEYGFFDADFIVLIISSHDYADNPSFQHLDEKTHPTETPSLALIEGITRYLPRYLPKFSDTHPEKTKITEKMAIQGLKDLKGFLLLAKKESRNVMVLQHWEKSELESGAARPGNKEIRVLCESLGITPISLEPYFRSSIKNGNNPYQDNIHPNPIGQKLIANAILENMQLLK